MSNSLREACGEEAKDILVALVCAFPAIYSYRCHNRSKYELTTRELKEAFEFVVGSMRQEYGSKVTTELCWASWCSIRYNYVQKLVLTPVSIVELTSQKLDSLTNFVQPIVYYGTISLHKSVTNILELTRTLPGDVGETFD
ncbi:hypothetical protein QR680_019336 [Steinernema hermaphroditum]|uniref:Uncharacterized protein n=1 Tax=Steinernema hermaphroditum TaxID=289476 RepID=A0AA39GNS5_9BILA|nr:hypothetical protein QR680_019336 [Steinernema hermaphroditum]